MICDGDKGTRTICERQDLTALLMAWY